jgi:hypothetical protein
MPQSLRPVWQLICVIATAMFLLDVAVRRVRIDIPLILGSIRALFGRGTTKGGAQLANLKAARDAAKASIAKRADGSISAADLEAQAKAAAKAAQVTAKAKFEAPPDLPTRTGTTILGGADAKVPVNPPKAAPTDSKQAPQQPGEGMSRLLKAKQKARDEMTD